MIKRTRYPKTLARRLRMIGLRPVMLDVGGLLFVGGVGDAEYADLVNMVATLIRLHPQREIPLEGETIEQWRARVGVCPLIPMSEAPAAGATEAPAKPAKKRTRKPAVTVGEPKKPKRPRTKSIPWPATAETSA